MVNKAKDRIQHWGEPWLDVRVPCYRAGGEGQGDEKEDIVARHCSRHLQQSQRIHRKSVEARVHISEATTSAVVAAMASVKLNTQHQPLIIAYHNQHRSMSLT